MDIGWIDGATPTYVHNPQLPKTAHETIQESNWIAKRHKNGILLGPFSPENCPFQNVHFSPLFTVPKPNLRSRTVCHLSSPRKGTSVNACIPDECKKVKYLSFQDVCQFVHDLGVGAYLWLVDAKDAYYRVPIKKKYWKYMGIRWFNNIFIFTSLQMGLGSGCALYQRFADSLIYILCNDKFELFIDEDGKQLVFHYLDDFFGGNSDENKAKDQMMAVWKLFILLGIPTAMDKLKWPDWSQIILGWLYDTWAQTVSLPIKKCRAYMAMIVMLIRERQKGTDKKTLERLDGRLEHASVVTFPGKTRLRNLQHALHLELRDYDDKIILSDLVILDLKWWLYALRYMNGIPLTWVISDPTKFDDECWTDAALKGELKIGGMGGCTASGIAYQVRNRQTRALYTSQQRKGVDINLMELLAAYLIAAQMAPRWEYKNIKFYIDNGTAAYALINKRAKLERRDLEYLTMKFCQLSARYHFRFWVQHIKGEENPLADALSRFKTSYKNTDLKLNEFEYIDVNNVIDTADGILSEIEKLPLNDDDPRLLFR